MQEGSSAAAVAPALGASSEPQKPPYAEAEAGASAGDVIAKETAWRLRLNRYNARRYTTYQGWWTLYSGAGTGNVGNQFHGVRCFRRAGEGGWQLQHKNLLAFDLKHGNPVHRPDGFWESDYVYSVDDDMLSCSIRPQAAEAEAGLVPHKMRRLTTATSNAYLVSPAALPPQPTGGDAALPGASWGFEAFLQDGINRWSLGAGYDAASGTLQRSFLIREYAIPLDTEAQHDPASLLIPQARPCLAGAEAAADMAAGRCGRLTEVRYGDDGLLRRTLDEADAAAPPLAVDASGYILLRYPDGMYAHIPEQLSWAGGSGGGGNGIVTFTWGGTMRREKLEFQQMTASYAIGSGALLSLANFAS